MESLFRPYGALLLLGHPQPQGLRHWATILRPYGAMGSAAPIWRLSCCARPPITKCPGVGPGYCSVYREAVFAMLAINAHTTVRDVLTAYPDTFDVFLRHGMCEDCKADPPPVPLHHFANKHCGGDIPGLINELSAVIGGR
jgi:hypothetical protein